MLTEDNKQISYLGFVGNTLENHGRFAYDVLGDLAITKYNLARPDKYSHPKETWNDQLNKVLNRSSFDSIIKMFALNTGNRITFVVDRINAKLLKKHFEGLK